MLLWYKILAALLALCEGIDHLLLSIIIHFEILKNMTLIIPHFV